MFEYAALVDAPVQRFTGIVTGADPDHDLVTVSVLPPTTPTVDVAEAPAMRVAVRPEPTEPNVSPLSAARIAAAIEPPRSLPAPFAPRERPGAPSRPPSPSFVPALVGAAIAGLTAMWWLRRENHDRGR